MYNLQGAYIPQERQKKRKKKVQNHHLIYLRIVRIFRFNFKVQFMHDQAFIYLALWSFLLSIECQFCLCIHDIDFFYKTHSHMHVVVTLSTCLFMILSQPLLYHVYILTPVVMLFACTFSLLPLPLCSSFWPLHITYPQPLCCSFVPNMLESLFYPCMLHIRMMHD